jgi:hypothetical protein
MDEKEELLKLKQNQLFESVQKDICIKRAELAEHFGHRGLLRSGPHSRAIIDLELSSLKKLLDTRLHILIEVFYRNSKPWTNSDKVFLTSRIEEYFMARLGASRESLLRYSSERGLECSLNYFEQEAASIFSDIKREIEISILENRIHPSELQNRDINELLKSDENNQLEFKSTFQWDIKNQTKNEKLRSEVISTIAAFNNTDGGYILIGVEDNKNIYGLDMDYSLLAKKNRDGFKLMLIQEVENKIGRIYLQKIGIVFHEINGKDICSIKVNIGEDTVWIKDGDSDLFFIRTHNSTRALSPRESAEYIRKKWSPKS